ncbi:MAG TPA: DUF3857 domain-containing protein [Mucilaginibacter sp.]|jgi:predicted secreted protein
MNKFITVFTLAIFAMSANAQTNPANPTVPTTQPFGKVSKEDLEMTSCDFEKDANAEILFHKGTVTIDNTFSLFFEEHERIKIFNEKGKENADVRILFYSGGNLEDISSVQAQTINSNNGNIEITKVDKKLIYTKKVDKNVSAITFSFPNVKPGSVVEYKYTKLCRNVGDFPDWYFQSSVPTRYSELNTSVPSSLYYKNLVMVHQPYVKNTDAVKSMANIPSLNNEPYMSSKKDNYERILYQLQSYNAGAASQSFSDSWKKVGEDEMDYTDFGGQFRRKLAGEDVIIAKAKGLKSDDEKIALIFDEVKNAMKWNEEDERYTEDGTSEAWDKKIGNSTEINLMVYHLLKKVGLKVFPMLVSTRENGKANPAYPSEYQFNRTVTYFPIDSNRFYILDATSKYNVYNEIPRVLLNGFGFYMDKDNQVYEMVFLQNVSPVRQVVMVNAEIKPDGKINGTAQVSSFGYNRAFAVKKYKTDGEKKYIDYLRDDDNNLKISSLKFDNMEVDSLPLTQNIDFTLDLAGSDEHYIYLNPNLFSGLRSNEFLSENRFTDIDFGYRNNYSINGIYKIPAGYKTDAMPKSASMTMSDNSISFRRIVAEQDGSIVVRYTIDFKKSMYFKENYPEFYAFFKKMNEMMNEPVVFKKG